MYTTTWGAGSGGCSRKLARCICIFAVREQPGRGLETLPRSCVGSWRKMGDCHLGRDDEAPSTTIKEGTGAHESGWTR